jgi:hypothetical protein
MNSFARLGGIGRDASFQPPLRFAFAANLAGGHFP